MKVAENNGRGQSLAAADRSPSGNGLFFQRKLTIGTVDDPMEYEADAIADHVMRIPAPSTPPDAGNGGGIQRKCAECEEEETVRRQPLVSFIKSNRGGSVVQRVAQNFIPELIAAQLQEAMEGWGTDEDAIYAALAGRPWSEVDRISQAYRRLSNRSLQADLEDELTSSELLHLAAVSSPFATSPEAQAMVIANQLKNAMEGWGTNEEAVYAGLSGRTPEMMLAIRASYQQLTQRDLMNDLRDDLNDSEFQRAMLLISGTSIAQLAPYVGSGGMSIGTEAVESSDEYKTLMNPQSPWQLVYHVTSDEARLVTLLILNHVHAGENYNWQTDAVGFIQSARQRLEHTAASQQKHTDRLDVEIGVVNVPDSIRLFNQMRDLTFFNSNGVESPVPFHYPANGCYTRAYMMEQRLTALGYASRKEFVISILPGKLTVASDYSSDTRVPGLPATTVWWYHVAPVIAVQQVDGIIVQMVIDPSLDSRPITIDSWTGKTRGDGFHAMSLDDVKAYLQNGKGFTGIGNVTYSVDRDNFYAGDVRSGPDGNAAFGQMQKVLGEISGYAESAPAHELAFFIRNELRAVVVNAPAIIQRINMLPSIEKGRFPLRFPNLVTDLYQRLTLQEQTSVTQAFASSP